MLKNKFEDINILNGGAKAKFQFLDLVKMSINIIVIGVTIK